MLTTSQTKSHADTMVHLSLGESWKARLQMLAIVTHVIAIPLSLASFFFFCAVPLLWPLVVIYLAHCYFDTRSDQGQPLTDFQVWFRNARWWKWYCAYYPITIHKTVDLEPCFEALPNRETRRFQRFYDLVAFLTCFFKTNSRAQTYNRPTGKRYIFGYHPHGIIGMGAMGGVSTEGAGWSKLFPGIPVRLMTLTNNFFLPFYREYVLGVGLASVSKESCLRFLNNNSPICIVLGGARESLLSHPGSIKLVLKRRSGFINLGLKTGASLVPMMAFGETDLYEQVPTDGDDYFATFHRFMMRVFGFTIPLFHARGIWNYSHGIIPYRHPVNVVVGRPIEMPVIESPTEEDINCYHDLYVKELERIFVENKERLWPDGTQERLEIVD